MTGRPNLSHTSRMTLAAGAFILAALVTVPAHAQLNVYIGSAPPPIRYEARPPIPGQGYAWVEGFWEPSGRGYRWHPGYWQQPPYAGAYYVHPHYDHYREGWHLHEGYWSREDHDDHHWDRGDRGDRGDHRDHDDHR